AEDDQRRQGDRADGDVKDQDPEGEAVGEQQPLANPVLVEPVEKTDDAEVDAAGAEQAGGGEDGEQEHLEPWPDRRDVRGALTGRWRVGGRSAAKGRLIHEPVRRETE